MNKNVKMIAEAGVMIALATVLSLIKIWKMPQGGSVTIGSMVPILIFAIRWGGIKGMLVGAVYGLLQFFIEPFPAGIWSIVLDYPLAFGMIGIAGFFGHKSKRFEPIVIGTTVGLLLRYVMHVISGIIFYYSYAPEGMSPLRYSAEYNLFILPELFISLVFLGIVFKRLQKIKI